MYSSDTHTDRALINNHSENMITVYLLNHRNTVKTAVLRQSSVAREYFNHSDTQSIYLRSISLNTSKTNSWKMDTSNKIS